MEVGRGGGVPDAKMLVVKCPKLAVDINEAVRRHLNVRVDEFDVYE